MSQIDFRLLQSAIVLAEELNFSRAASRLHLTQPGLTKQIQDLESQLGVILFERSSQGVELTEPGRVFIEHAKLAVFHLERAVHLTRAAAKGAEVVINFGSSPYIDPYIVSTLLSVRLSLFPTMRVHAHSHFSQELMRQVSSGELDMAIIATGEENRRLNFLEIESHPLFALMQTQDAATKQRVLSLTDFDDRVWVLFGKHVHPTMHDSLLSRAEELGVAPSEIQYFTTAEEAAYLVAKHQGMQQYPLQYEVGEAILAYLRFGRVRNSSGHLFLSLMRPYGPLSSTVVWQTVGKRLRPLGLDLEHIGPHSLRHTCATRLLKKGASLSDIAEYLGHHDTNSIGIYAKHDGYGLRQVAAFGLTGLR